MSEKINIKAVKTAVAPKGVSQGKYRWSIEYKSGEVMDKYNVDGTKNVYCSREQLVTPEKISNLDVKQLTHTQLAIEAMTQLQKAAFAEGRSDIQLQEDGWYRLARAKVNVPLTDATSIGLKDAAGNIVAVMDVPAGAKVFQRRRVRDVNYHGRYHDARVKVGGRLSSSGRWIPERWLSKRVPEYTYSEFWLIGWRTKTEVRYKVVYPDGLVEEFTEWNVKPWLYEPEWFTEEKV